MFTDQSNNPIYWLKLVTTLLKKKKADMEQYFVYFIYFITFKSVLQFIIRYEFLS